MAQKHRVLIVFVCLSGIRKLQHKIFLKPPVISNYKNTFFSWCVAFFLAPKHEKTASFFSYDWKKISIASSFSYKVARGGVNPSFLNYQFSQVTLIVTYSSHATNLVLFAEDWSCSKVARTFRTFT